MYCLYLQKHIVALHNGDGQDVCEPVILSFGSTQQSWERHREAYQMIMTGLLNNGLNERDKREVGSFRVHVTSQLSPQGV
jgi:hypothetical protein